MWNTRRIGLVALIVAGLLGSAPDVRAQFNFNPSMNPGMVSGLTQAQYIAFLQQAAAARAAQAQALFPGGGGAVNPYAPVTANPYAPVTANPYSPYVNPYGSPYDSGYTNPYLSYYGHGYGAGSVLMGQADVMRAYGMVIMSQEQARIIRQQSLQASLDTKKKKVDLDLYIKSVTPTFTEEQLKIAKQTLIRIRNMSTEAEIVNGKALNLLLGDMAKYAGKKATMEPIPLSEDVLRHLNITKGNFSLGVLRSGGEFNWPIVFQEFFAPDQLKLVQNQSKMLVKGADLGKVDATVIRDMRNELEKLGNQLSKKINEIPTSQYVDAQRFLGDLESARSALERGEGMTQINYQKWASGGKSVPQLVDYMVSNGLRFTTSVQGDEFAYRAAYNAMAALDVALEAQFSVSPESREVAKEP